MHKQECRGDADAAQRGEIAHRVVMHMFIQAGIDCVGGHCRHQDRVAVWRRPRDRLSPDIAAGAVFVFGDELLTEQLSHFRAHDPPNDVSWSARGKWNDHQHRACRIIVSRAHRRTCKRRYQHGAGKSAKRAALDCSSKNRTPPSMLFGHDISSHLAEGYHHRKRRKRWRVVALGELPVRRESAVTAQSVTEALGAAHPEGGSYSPHREGDADRRLPLMRSADTKVASAQTLAKSSS